MEFQEAYKIRIQGQLVERKPTIEDDILGIPAYSMEDATMGKPRYLTLQEQIGRKR